MSKRVASICAAAAVLVLGAACQPAPPPPPPKRVTLVGTLERDIIVGRYSDRSYVRGDSKCEPRVVERRFDLEYRSGDRWRPYVYTLRAGSEVEFTTWDHPECLRQNGYTRYNGREFAGPPFFLEVATSDNEPDYFVTVPYYDGFSIPK